MLFKLCVSGSHQFFKKIFKARSGKPLASNLVTKFNMAIVLDIRLKKVNKVYHEGVRIIFYC